MKTNYLFTFLISLIIISYSVLAYAQVPEDFPSITTQKTGETAPGYIFLTVSSDSEETGGVGYYVFMIDDDGIPFKYKKLGDDYSYDFKAQPNGLLSYAQFLSHHSYTGGGNCIHMVLDENMEVVDSFQLKNGYIAEAHDFQLLPNGHVLAFGYYLTQMDLSDLVDGGYPNAMVSGGIVQELDTDKNVVWQWRSWDHYDPENYEFGRRSARQTVSEFHLNTINLDDDGHMFLGTPSWTKKINRQTGEIMWHLGGDENEFSFVGVDSLEGVSDVTGHAFYRLENGNVLIYDNGSRRGGGTSEAHEYKLDEENLIAEKIQTFTPETDIAAWHRGNAQRLPNGNTLVGWGGASGDPIPTCTEFDSLGNTVFEVFFDNPAVESYRAVRFPYPPEPQYDTYIEEVALGNIYRFLVGDTLDIGVEVNLTDLVSVGYNELILTTYDYAPLFPEFEGRAPMVLPMRAVLSKYSINYVGGELSFNADSFGIPDPGNITVYFRPTEGEGMFTPLSTTYNPVKNEITATFDDFGEFIFGYPDIVSAIINPVTRHPENEAMVNFEDPLQLEWSQEGFFNSFSLQVSTDDSFSDPIIDESGLKSTIYDLTELEPNQDYFWRVKTSNDAGESDWSETGRFYTTSPYIELTSPDGDEVWTRGLDFFIEWKTNFGDPVILDLYKDSEFVQTIDTADNTTAYFWSIPADLDSACNYHISIRSAGNPMINDVSDQTFSINDSSCTASVVPHLELLTPNGGEVIGLSQVIEISWKNNTGELVSIDLFKNGEKMKTLFTEINENSVFWEVDEDITPGDDYSIVVTTEDGTELSDGSNSVFEVTIPESVSKAEPDSEALWLYPNPVRDLLNIEFRFQDNTAMRIKLYDINGKELSTVVVGNHSAGKQHLELDMTGYPAGTYLIRLENEKHSESRKFYYVK